MTQPPTQPPTRPTDRPLEPELARRLQHVYRLSGPPATLEEYRQLLRARNENEPRMRAYLAKVEAGEAVIGACSDARRYSYARSEGGEAAAEGPAEASAKASAAVNVMCAYDTLMTAILRTTAAGGGAVSRGHCPHCEAPMEVRFEDGKLVSAAPASMLFWLGTGPIGAPGNPVCDHLHIFPDETHLQAWLADNPDELGVPLPIAEAARFMAGYVPESGGAATA